MTYQWSHRTDSCIRFLPPATTPRHTRINFSSLDHLFQDTARGHRAINWIKSTIYTSYFAHTDNCNIYIKYGFSETTGATLSIYRILLSMKRSYTHAQHFLRSPQLAAELVGHADIGKHDVVYDLGAGSGVITSVLAPRCRAVVAVEVEPHALGQLRTNMTRYDNVTIVEQDILKLMPPAEPYKILANIPFSLSAPIVRKFTEDEHAPKAIYLIVQKQFARKLVPGDDHFTSQLAAQLGARFTARIRRPLQRSDFTPPPAVDTVLLELKLRDTPLIPAAQLGNYRDFVGRCFAEQKFFADVPRAKANISPELRPSQLTLEQWSELYRQVAN